MYVSVCSYYNIMTFISYKQELDYTNTSYVVCVYVSLVFILLDTMLCAVCDSTLFIIYNVVYLSCVINTITTYGNLLSILLFVFESTNVSIDWFCVNRIRNQTRMGLRFDNVTTTMMFVVYIMVNKIVVTPM